MKLVFQIAGGVVFAVAVLAFLASLRTTATAEEFGKNVGYLVIGLFFGIGILYAIYDAIRKWRLNRKP